MNDKELNQLIKESLTTEEAAYYDQLDEPNLVEKITTLYTGKLRWISLVQSVVMTIVFALGVYATIQFYSGEDVVSMLRWGFAALVALIMSSMVKLVLLQEIQEKALQREMKRIELQIAHVAKSVRDNQKS